MYSRKHIFQVSYPIFFTLVAQNIINVTDTAFLGRVSEVALGASAVAGVFYIAVYMVGFGFSQGMQILIGRRNGENNPTAIGETLNSGVLFNLFFATIVFLLSLWFMPQTMRLLVSSDQIYAASVEYLDWRSYGFFFSFLNVTFRAFFVGITRTKPLTYAAFLTAIINVVFDYLLIFGKFGFPPMGIAGAALASVLAEMVTTLYFVMVVWRQKDRKEMGLFRFAHIHYQTIRSIFSVSIFIILQYVVSVSTWFMFFVFIERLGERQLATTNIARSIYTLLMIPGSALSTTVSSLVSNMIGENKKEQVVPFFHKTVRLTMWFVIPLMLLTFLFAENFIRIYTDNPSLIADSVATLKIVSVIMVFCSMGHLSFSAVLGTGNTKTAFGIEIASLIAYLVYNYYTAIVLRLAVEVVWLSEFLYWTPIALLGYLYLLKGNWRDKQI